MNGALGTEDRGSGPFIASGGCGAVIRSSGGVIIGVEAGSFSAMDLREGITCRGGRIGGNADGGCLWG